jgi:peptidoglycan/xylan/chitin deacetylase (PgdA/CDA1 family)
MQFASFVALQAFAFGLATGQAWLDQSPPDFWENGTGLAVSFVFGLEAGGQPRIGSKAPSESWEAMANTLASLNKPDYATNSWYEYGIHEGVPRVLNLFDAFGVKASCLISVEAASASPALAREVVKRGHEAVCHGTTFNTLLEPAAERQFLQDKIDITERITGERCTGFNALWMQHTANTNGLLQELNFTYYVDDVSRDIPFTKEANGRKLAVVPYTLRNHDIETTGRGFSAMDFYTQFVAEFDELFLESQTRHRMMTVTIHDNVGGTPVHRGATRERDTCHACRMV